MPGNINRAKKILIYLLLGALYLGLSKALIATENVHILKISFVGNQTFSRDELLQVIKLRTPGKLEGFVFPQSGPLPDVKVLREDRERLIRFYQQEGFLFVSIPPPRLVVNSHNGTAEVIYHIQEGPPILVQKVDFRYQAPNPEIRAHVRQLVERHRPELQLVASSRFRDAHVLHDQLLLYHTILDRGYPYAKVHPELQVQEDSARVTVVWHIRTGPRCVFDSVFVEGNQKVKPEIILRQVAFRPGDMYQKSLLEKTQMQVFGLGLFEAVEVKAVLDSTRSTKIPVKIVVREAPRFTARTGVGYGKEDRFRAFVNLVRLGAFGGARRTEVILKHSALEPYNVDVKIIQPVFLRYRTSASLNPFLRKEQEPGYTVTRLGGKLSIMRRFHRYIRGSINYLYEYVDRATGSVPESVRSTTPEDDLYNKAGPILGLTYDSSQPLFNPTGGLFVFTNLKANGLFMETDYQFLKWVLDARKYRQVLGSVLAVRFMIGGIHTWGATGAVPVEDRFYSGGITSVRGWGRQQLGPLDPDGRPLGGKSIIEGNLEWRMNLIKKLTGALFLDFGNVWRETSTYRLDELRYSLGVGLGIATPIGPIRMDFARPVFDVKTSWEWHLNVGQSF